MTVEEQQKMVEDERANAKTNKIISLIFVAAFCAAPVGLISYHAYGFLKDKYESKIKQQQKQDLEPKAKNILSFSEERNQMLSVFNVRQK